MFPLPQLGQRITMKKLKQLIPIAVYLLITFCYALHEPVLALAYWMLFLDHLDDVLSE